MNLRDALTSIYHERGLLTPALVVDIARPEDHPLHSHFEWNDTVAGEAYRRDQAHKLIASVRVVYAEDKDGRREVRAFVATPTSTPQPSYTPIGEALGDEVSRAIVLRDFERQVATLQRRYGHLVEFDQIMRKHVGRQAA